MGNESDIKTCNSQGAIVQLLCPEPSEQSLSFAQWTGKVRMAPWGPSAWLPSLLQLD